MKLSNYLLKTALMAFCINLAIAPVAHGMEKLQRAELLKKKSRRINRCLNNSFLMNICLCAPAVTFGIGPFVRAAYREIMNPGSFRYLYDIFLPMTLSTSLIALFYSIINQEINEQYHNSKNLQKRALVIMNDVESDILSNPRKIEECTPRELVLILDHAFKQKNNPLFILCMPYIRNNDDLLSGMLDIAKNHDNPDLIKWLSNLQLNIKINRRIDASMQNVNIQMPVGVMRIMADYVACAEPSVFAEATPDAAAIAETEAERETTATEELATQSGFGLGGQAGVTQERVESKRQAAKQKEN